LQFFRQIFVTSAKPLAPFCRVLVVAAVLMSEVSGLSRPQDIAVVPDLESLFRAHFSRLVRALTAASGSREAAADAVQEAFVKAHLHWRRVQRYDDPVGWIRRVAINRLRDDHRRSGRKERALQRLGAEAATTATITAEWSDEAETGRLLAELPRQQRLAMALYYVSELSIAEVADALEISEGAVKFHLSKGRERLRGVVAGDDQHEEAT
jgi:RNA polymerase sigma-70 factor (ECF subfamily)